MRGAVFAAGGPGGEGGEDPLFEVGFGEVFADQGGEFEAEASAVFDADGGMVMTGDDDGVRGEVGGQRFVAVMEKEAGLFVVSGEGGVAVEGAVVVVSEEGDQGGDEEAEAGEEVEGFSDVGGAVHDVAHQDEGVGLVVAEEVGEAGFEGGAAPIGGEVAFAAAAEFVAVVEVGDGHPALGGVDEGVAVVEPDAVGDVAEPGIRLGRNGGRILWVRAGICAEVGY